jgi:hypothetical protein
VAQLAPILSQHLPADLLLIRHFDVPHGCLEDSRYRPMALRSVRDQRRDKRDVARDQPLLASLDESASRLEALNSAWARRREPPRAGGRCATAA